MRGQQFPCLVPPGGRICKVRQAGQAKETIGERFGVGAGWLRWQPGMLLDNLEVLFQLGPTGKPMTACDHQVGLIEGKLLECLIGMWMKFAYTCQRVRLARMYGLAQTFGLF